MRLRDRSGRAVTQCSVRSCRRRCAPSASDSSQRRGSVRNTEVVRRRGRRRLRRRGAGSPTAIHRPATMAPFASNAISAQGARLMDPRVIAAFATHGGVLSRDAAARSRSVRPREIRRLVRQGALGRACDAASTRRPRSGRRSTRTSVGRGCGHAPRSSMMRRGWVLSHDSAAHEQRHADPHARSSRSSTSPARASRTPGPRTASSTTSPASPDQQRVVRSTGRPMLDLARTAVDIARERGIKDGLVACDSAMRMGVTRAELQAAVEPMEHWPGSRACPPLRRARRPRRREPARVAGTGTGLRGRDRRAGDAVPGAHDRGRQVVRHPRRQPHHRDRRQDQATLGWSTVASPTEVGRRRRLGRAQARAAGSRPSTGRRPGCTGRTTGASGEQAAIRRLQARSRRQRGPVRRESSTRSWRARRRRSARRRARRRTS